ncbi:MAG: L-threonylcarbamoyladenylate synthase [Verrucomicrobiota bacterium]
MMSKLVARVFSGSPVNLSRLAKVLRSGGIVAAPTETVYGLAGNALDPKACRKIFRAKLRPATDPLIVHVLGLDDLDRYAYGNSSARLLARKFWPGPLTIVLRKRTMIPSVVSAGRNSVALRSPAHPLFRRLLRLSGVPLAAPSANPFGYVSPTTAEHVRSGLGLRIQHILNGGSCAIGLESTIVDLRDAKRPRILRPGAITRSQIEQVLKVPVRERRSAGRYAQAQVAPGMLTRHYSPRTSVILHAVLDKSSVLSGAQNQAWVFLAKPSRVSGKNIYWMDRQGDLERVARGLFAMLRRLDVAGYARLNFECAPGKEGMAAAINDRLRRAAAKA